MLDIGVFELDASAGITAAMVGKDYEEEIPGFVHVDEGINGGGFWTNC